MNDITVMYPLPATADEYAAMLVPTSPGLGGQLMPESIYDTDSNHAFFYSSLHAVGFRLDPCFGAPTMPCQNQLRIVFQPIDFDGSGTPPAVAEDQAVHVFYELSRDQLLAAADELATARADDNGDGDLGPLAPNAVLAREGLTGSLAQRYADIVGRYAGQDNVIKMTTLALLEFDTPATTPPTEPEFGADWSLHGVNFGSGSATPQQIPSLPPQTTSMNFGISGAPVSADASPETMSTDNESVLFSASSAGSATATARQAAFDAALRVENPLYNSPDTIDCASCHLAQPARQLVGEPLGLTEVGNPNAYLPPAFIPAADLVQTTPLVGSDGGISIHAFSYRNVSPMINQRVINETAANLAIIRDAL